MTSNVPLLCYSTNSRAQIVSNPTTKKQMTFKKKSKGRVGKRRSHKSKVHISKGQVAIKVTGYKGLQRLAASQLIRFVPLNKIKLAAKKVLKISKKLPKRRLHKRKRLGKKKNH